MLGHRGFGPLDAVARDGPNRLQPVRIANHQHQAILLGRLAFAARFGDGKRARQILQSLALGMGPVDAVGDSQLLGGGSDARECGLADGATVPTCR